MLNLSGIDLNLLNAFEALYRERNVTRAGRRIGLSQPAMSNALARLRDLFQDRLFVRGGRTMEPTLLAEGLAIPIATILEQTQALFKMREEFDPAVSDLTFRVGLSDYSSTLLLPAIAQCLSVEAPNLRLQTRHIVGQAALRMMDAGDLDLAMGSFGDTPGRFQRRDMIHERFLVIARQDHPELHGEDIDLNTYLRLPHVLVSFDGGTRGWVDRELSKRGLSRHVALTVPHFVSAPFVVGASDMIATVSSRIAQRFREPCGLVLCEPPLPIPDYESSLVWHQRSDTDPGHAWLRGRMTAMAETLADDGTLAESSFEHHAET